MSSCFRGRAPIASMDGMEELDGLDMLTGGSPGLQPDCHVLGKPVYTGVPGLRYRHLGKSGLKVIKPVFGFSRANIDCFCY